MHMHKHMHTYTRPSRPSVAPCNTLPTHPVCCREIARVAYETNRTVENIGARRLHTVIERIVEEVSFDAPEKVRMEKQPLCLRVRPVPRVFISHRYRHL